MIPQDAPYGVARHGDTSIVCSSVLFVKFYDIFCSKEKTDGADTV